MILDKIPEKMVVVGAGAIGVEFAHLYNTFGTNVTLIEAMPHILPNEENYNQDKDRIQVDEIKVKKINNALF